MKKLVIAALMVVSFTTFAQEKNAPQDRKSKPQVEQFTPEQRVELQVKKMTLDLGLSASQQKDVKTLLQEDQKNREIRMNERKNNTTSDQKLSADERYAKASKRLDDQIVRKDKMKKILSTEQFAKWEKAKDDQKAKFAHRMHNKKRDSKKMDK
ncbi:hypothetical protein [Flavobacterium sp. '19STA2R22 D10 B1']|uniref:hypothetical protein n=1 Tax=Flavobacterium aerium TaxID=3037261 RepID=UPI00278BDAC4|nr:hypothetical protein [Flavobacterium sp. '19STA2R22 D10 B1']